MNNDIMSVISGILSDPEAKEKLINTISSVSDSSPSPSPPPVPSFPSADNLAIMMRIRDMMDRLNNTNDSRITLLNSMRPFMKNGRERSIDTAIKFIQIINFASGR